MEGTRIVLVRHGESRAQEQGFFGGHDGCQGLSDRGRAQAAALHDRLRLTGELAEASVLYTSLMSRARETAEILAPALNGLEVRAECDFCEGHPGEADGLSWAEIDQRYPPAEWDADTRRAPGWETWREMATRVTGALEALVARHPGETIVVACHGGVIVHSMLHFLSLGDGVADQRAWMSADNTSLTEWRFASNPYQKGTLPVELVRFNDFAHLTNRSLR
ncbi:MAG: histidine phosphatase family protein [Acidimicrobiales bacterium]